MTSANRPIPIEIIVGHTPKRQGARSCVPIDGSKRAEYYINTIIGARLQTALCSYGYTWRAYLTFGEYALTKKAQRANEHGVEVVLELHCNSYRDPKAGGTSMLYCAASPRGKVLAGFLQERVCSVLKFKDRGVKPIKRGQRGWPILWKTRGVAVICEPLFLSNPVEANILRYGVMRGELVRAYLHALFDYRKWLFE